MSVSPLSPSDPVESGAAATVAPCCTGAEQNAAPVARDDAYAMNGHQQLGANVLANDRDADGDALSAVLVSGPRHGTLTLTNDGSFIYTPDRGFDGIDTFAYVANDGQNNSNIAVASIAVTGMNDPVNDPPAAADDQYRVDEDQVLSIPGPGVLENDADANGDALRSILTAGPRAGVLVLGTDGSFEYTPNAGFSGTDSFTYVANDGQADSSPATVTMTVDAVNHAPTTADDSYSTLENQPLSIPTAGVLANDQDPDGDALTAALTTGPANGAVDLAADGSFEYTPNAGFSGTDSFTYVANDGQADSSPATVTLTVNPLEEPPAKDLSIHLEVSGTAFGPEAGPTWSGSTFWVSVYVKDLRTDPQGVVGGAFDLALLIAQQGSAQDSGGFDAKFDLNGDSRVDSGDVAILLPRLYDPILGNATPPPHDPPAASGPTTPGTAPPASAQVPHDRLHHHALRSEPGWLAAQTWRAGFAPWPAAFGHDLDWGKSAPSLGKHDHHGFHGTRAIDHVLKHEEVWYFI